MKQICLFLLSISIFNIICVQMTDAQVKTNNSVRRKVVSKSKTKPKIRFINLATLAKSPSYTHVVEVTGGRTIYISGQIAVDSSGNTVGRGDFRAQTVQVFENIKAALESVGASFKDVIKLNIYVVDISQLTVLREVRAKYINTEQPPTSTLVQVRGLVREELLVEIEATAVLPK